ncbi:MAG TPA: hypothetical protein VFW17_18300 [Ktedonobacterales bacterium]|jgi:hypothetical protein|nr:hypothetical protein [Ktedonobacterales bacterium]
MTVWQLSGWQQVIAWLIVGICLALSVITAVVSALRAVRQRAWTLSLLGRRARWWDLLGLELAAGAFLCFGAVFLVSNPALQATLVVIPFVAVSVSVFVRAHAGELRNREWQSREQLRPDNGGAQPTAP